jgi:hypothetical protein
VKWCVRDDVRVASRLEGKDVGKVLIRANIALTLLHAHTCVPVYSDGQSLEKACISLLQCRVMHNVRMLRLYCHLYLNSTESCLRVATTITYATIDATL